MKRLIVFFVLMSQLMGYGQDPNNFNPELPKIIPPSPTAYELGKYGQIPVGLFTGTPNISIPIYTFSTKNLSIPIQLSYNSNGIKVDQLSSNVGLGWSLNAGGVITRIIRDEPDENRLIDGASGIPYMDTATPNLNNPLVLEYFKFISNENIDSETDLYMYNFMGKTGKFVFNNEKKILLTNQNSLRIEGYYENISGSLKTGFKITDELGIVYIFLDSETSITRSSGGGHSIPSDPSITTWYLTRIIHPKGDVINFIYDYSNYEYVTGISQTFTMPIPIYQAGCQNSSGTGVGYTISPEISNNLRIIGKKLVEISSNKTIEGKVLFTYNVPHPEIIGYQLLTNIKVEDNQQHEIENVNLDYLVTGNNRVFLNEISYKDPQKKYQFQYFDPESFPNRLSKSTDYWGFYNHKTNLYRFPNPHSKLLQGYIHQSFLYYNIGANKEIDTVYEKKGMLRQITYPTKGFNTFDYESNSYYGQEIENPDKTIIHLQNNTDGNNNNNPDENEITGTIPFNHIADFRVFVSYNAYSCGSGGDTGHNTATINISDDSGEDVVIMEYFPAGYDQVGTNSITVHSDDTNKHFYVNLKKDHSYTITLSNHSFCTESSVRFNYYQQNYTILQKNIDIGGVRIKRISSYDASNNLTNNIRYYYGSINQKDISSADKGRNPYYITKHTIPIICEYDNGYNPTIPLIYHYYQSLNSNSLRQLYSSSNTQTTSYHFVTVSQGGDLFENGGEEHEFIINPDGLGNPLLGDPIDEAPLVNSGWDNGLEKKVTYYKRDNSSGLIKTQEVVNEYKQVPSSFDRVVSYAVRKKYEPVYTSEIYHVCSASDINEYWEYHYCSTNHFHFFINIPFDGRDYPVCVEANNNMITERIYNHCHGHNVGDTITYRHSLDNLDIMSYTTNSYWHYLYKQTKKVYDKNGQNSVISVQNYYYENPIHKLLTRQTFLTSENKLSENKFLYPDDIGSNNNNLDFPLPAVNNNQRIAIDSLKTPSSTNPYSQHKIGVPVQVQSYIDGELLMTKRTNFKDFGLNVNNKHLILPESVSITKTDNTLEPRIIYHHYDQYGNPTEVSQPDGTHIYYIYGYHHSKPIAKIVNFTQAQAQSLQAQIHAVVTASDNDEDAASEAALRTALDNLRQALPDNTQVTTYTYDPLIGITSITDPKGDTQYYIYDSFNRLKYIKDKDGHILKEYEYHYR